MAKVIGQNPPLGLSSSPRMENGPPSPALRFVDTLHPHLPLSDVWRCRLIDTHNYGSNRLRFPQFTSLGMIEWTSPSARA